MQDNTQPTVRLLIMVGGLLVAGTLGYAQVSSTANRAESRAERNRLAMELMREDLANTRTDIAVILTKIESIEQSLNRLLGSKED